MNLNLASNPFRNRALPWTVTAIVTVFSVIALIFIAKWTFDTNAKAQGYAREVAGLREQANSMNKRAEQIKTALTPEQQRSLKSAHTLVNRKRFSWSRLFADLEGVLPGTIKVTRIAVKEVGTQDDQTVANLELVVASKSSAYVTQLIEKMEREGVFHAELVAQNQQRGRGDGSSEYEMSVRYTPRAGAPIAPGDRNQPVDTANQGAQTR
jgi:Tfp pilus assembly protein PilN